MSNGLLKYSVYTLAPKTTQFALIPISSPNHWVFTKKNRNVAYRTLPTDKLPMLVQGTDDPAVTLNYVMTKFGESGWKTQALSEHAFLAKLELEAAFDPETQMMSLLAQPVTIQLTIYVTPVEEFSAL